MNLEKHRLQIHIAALERQPRRLGSPSNAEPFFGCWIFHNFHNNCNQAARSLSVVLSVVKRRHTQTHPAALR